MRKNQRLRHAKKTGRPRKGEVREQLKLVNFRADGQTLRAIEKLTAAFPAGALGRVGAAIRTALIEAAGRLDLRGVK